MRMSEKKLETFLGMANLNELYSTKSVGSLINILVQRLHLYTAIGWILYVIPTSL